MVHQHHRHNHRVRDFGDFLDDLGNAVGLGNDDSDEKAEKRQGSTRIVYVTQSPTFTDAIAGYSTSGESAPETTAILLDSSTTKKAAPKTTAAPKESTTAAAKSTKATDIALSGLPSSIVPSSTFDTSNSEVLLASQTETTSDEATPTPTISPSATPSSIPDSSSSGMTAGAKAGLAIGIIAIVGAILSLIFFCLRQRKKAEERERLDDEKFTNVVPPGAAAAGAAGAPASMRGLKRLSSAPRLDVRPTTAFFMPNRASQMQNPAAAAGNGIQMTSQNRGMEQNRANPFGNHAESIDPVNAAGPSVVDGVVIAGAAAGAAAGAKGPVRSTSRGAQNKYAGAKTAQSPFTDAARTDGNRGPQNTSQQMHNTGVMPQPLAGVIEEGGSGSGPTSPVSATAVMVGGAVTSGAASETNLYRVHLDFSPSMPDELRVRGGEIVKLLKEFDDGWCMCIKEDGSAEGVLPRTCISNSPIAARRSPSNKSVPGPFQNNQRRHSPTGSNAPLYPSHQNQNQGPGPNQGPNQNRNGPPMNGNRGPQYRPQQGGPPQNRGPQQQRGPPQGPNQGGRPMSPAMSANGNGRNSPGPGRNSPGPQYRPQQQGPMSPAMNRGPPQGQGPQTPQYAQAQQQQQQQAPSSPPPHAISSPSQSSVVANVGSSSPVAAAAAVALPSSPALSQGSGGFSIPEVTITAPSGPVASAAPVVVERKPVGVGRKPVGGGQ